MRARTRGLVALAGSACLIGQYLAVPMIASAATGAPVPYSQANFSGYASGDELHLGAVTLGTTQVADVEQALSGATTKSPAAGGLTTELKDPDPTAATNTGTIVQPAQAASVNAYGMGSGLEVGVATSSTAATDANQLDVSGKAQSIAPPISAAVTKTIAVPTALSTIVTGDSLTGRSDAVYNPNVCTIGQPLSYGLGAASNIALVNLAGTPSVVSTSGSTAAETASTTSDTYLNANADGTFGLASTATETVAPITVNLPDSLGSLSVTLSGNQAGTAPATPVTLTTVSTGEGTSTVSLTNDNFLTVNLTLAGVTTALVPPTALAGLTAPRVVTLPDLGTITINTLTQSTSGNAASAAFTLFGLNLNLAGVLPLVNLETGHMVAGATANSAITCNIPILKTSTPTSLTAGHDFVYTIEIPNPADIAELDCSLSNVSAVDVINDAPSSGAATFQVLNVNDGGKITQTSTTTATVSWTGLSYTLGNPPLTLSITVAVPTDSPKGVIQDVVNAKGTAEGCTGGVSGVTNLGATNGTSLTGSYTLQQPSVTAVAPVAAAASETASPAAAASLPVTGSEGGLWQPGLGLVILILGGGGLALVRRSRRRTG